MTINDNMGISTLLGAGSGNGLGYIKEGYFNGPAFTTDSAKFSSVRVENRLVLNGNDVAEWMLMIENLLGMPTRDPKMELLYPELEVHWNNYMDELRNKLSSPELIECSLRYKTELEKYNNWHTLKTI